MLLYNLEQEFPNCGRRAKCGSLVNLLWLSLTHHYLFSHQIIISCGETMYYHLQMSLDGGHVNQSFPDSCKSVWDFCVSCDVCVCLYISFVTYSLSRKNNVCTRVCQLDVYSAKTLTFQQHGYNELEYLESQHQNTH